VNVVPHLPGSANSLSASRRSESSSSALSLSSRRDSSATLNGEQSDQSLGPGGRRIEVPRGQVPLLENKCATRLDQPPVCGDLLAAAAKRGDQVARVDEVEGVRLELAFEQIVDDELDVRDLFRVQE